EVALAHAQRRQLVARRARGGRLGADGLLQRGDPPLALGDGAGLRVQALIHQLQRREDLDLRRQSPSVAAALRRRGPPLDRRWWAQCDSNTRPTGYEPAALTARAMGPLGASQAPNRARCKGRSGFREGAQAARAARMTELAQRLRLDLADALARDPEARPDLLERVVSALPDAKAQPQHLLLARRERGQHLPRLILEVHGHHRVGGRERGHVLDEVADDGVLLLADRRLERDRLLVDLHDPAHLVDGDIHALADLLRRGLAAHLLHQGPRGAHQLVDRLDHVHGDADGARLIGDRARDRLPDPPRGVGRELVAAPVLELVDRAHEPDVALLDEVEELEAAVHVPLRDRHDQTEVGLDHLLLGGAHAALGGVDVAHRALERAERHADLPLELGQLAARVAD